MLVTEAACTVCGGPTRVFASSGRAQKYCSPKCRTAANSQRTWKLAIPCAACGREFKPLHHTGKYCSKECGGRAYLKMRQARRLSVLPDVYCHHCGEKIYPAKPNQKFCSPKCRAEAPEKKLLEGFVCHCIQCGTEFKGASKALKICSRECHLSRAREKHNAAYEPAAPIKLKCMECGGEFDGRPNRKYCSHQCRRKFAKKAWKTQKKKFTHKQRADRWHRRYEAINPQKVFERDGWVCGICFAPVDRDTVVPDPLAASLDHRIPLSKGGNHTWDNVRCAHFGCNSIKSDKLDEEIKWPEADHQNQPQT